jgi:hypothetical protein
MDKPKIDNRELETLFRAGHSVDEVCLITGRSFQYCKYRYSLLKLVEETNKERLERKHNG